MPDTIQLWPSSGIPSGWSLTTGTAAACGASAKIPGGANSLQITGGGTDVVVTRTAADIYGGQVTGQFLAYIATGGTNLLDFRFRQTDSTDQIILRIQNSTGLQLLKVVSNAATFLATVTFAVPSNGLYNVVSRAVGSSLKFALQRVDTGFWLNSSGTWQSGFTYAISQTDSSLTGAGQVAFYSSGVAEVGTYSEGLAGTPALAPSSATVSVGATQQLTRTGFTGLQQSAASGSPSTATVSGSLLVTGVAAGSATITATGAFDATETATSAITVNSLNATATTLSLSSSSGYAGAPVTLTVGGNGNWTGTKTGTLSDGGAGGVFSPTSISGLASATTASVVYTPPVSTSTAAITLTATLSGLTPATQAYSATADTITASPTTLSTNATTLVTFTDPAGLIPSSPPITVSGLSGVSIASVTKVNATTATAQVTTGSTIGTATFAYATTGVTASVSVASIVGYVTGITAATTPTLAVYGSTGSAASINGGTPQQIGTTGVWIANFTGSPDRYVAVWTVNGVTSSEFAQLVTNDVPTTLSQLNTALASGVTRLDQAEPLSLAPVAGTLGEALAAARSVSIGKVVYTPPSTGGTTGSITYYAHDGTTVLDTIAVTTDISGNILARA